MRVAKDDWSLAACTKPMGHTHCVDEQNHILFSSFSKFSQPCFPFHRSKNTIYCVPASRSNELCSASVRILRRPVTLHYIAIRCTLLHVRLGDLSAFTLHAHTNTIDTQRETFETGYNMWTKNSTKKTKIWNDWKNKCTVWPNMRRWRTIVINEYLNIFEFLLSRGVNGFRQSIVWMCPKYMHSKWSVNNEWSWKGYAPKVYENICLYKVGNDTHKLQ